MEISFLHINLLYSVLYLYIHTVQWSIRQPNKGASDYPRMTVPDEERRSDGDSLLGNPDIENLPRLSEWTDTAVRLVLTDLRGNMLSIASVSALPRRCSLSSAGPNPVMTCGSSHEIGKECGEESGHNSTFGMGEEYLRTSGATMMQSYENMTERRLCLCEAQSVGLVV